MPSLSLFSFESREIRTLTLDGNPWFVGKDVAEALGFKDTVNAIKLHCKGVAKYHPLPTPGGTQEVRIINEPDTFRLIANSTLPAAERFEAWLFEEVLPAIRKTGGYALPGAQPAPTDIAALAQQLADLLKGKVVVDYDSLCRFARMGRAAVARLVEVEKLLDETERVGLELEKQCGHPLIRLDMPAERLARHRAAPPRRATAPPDPWEPQVRAYAADRQEVISAEVLRHLGIEDGDQTQTQKNRIANILKNLGFVGYMVHRGGRVHRVWQRHHHG